MSRCVNCGGDCWATDVCSGCQEEMERQMQEDYQRQYEAERVAAEEAEYAARMDEAEFRARMELGR